MGQDLAVRSGNDDTSRTLRREPPGGGNQKQAGISPSLSSQRDSL